jgi:RNA polymerase sigma-70 factor (ECF subfamily)
MASETAVIQRLTGWVFAASEEDWDALFVEQLPRVYNFFRYRVGHGPEAEDLTSITFEKAWQARHRYRRDLAAFSTWLLTIARNVATDHFRRRRDVLPLDAARDVAGGATPEDLAERSSDRDRLVQLLEALPERERELIALKYGAGMTNRAIARVTGLGESNVGTVLHRTIERLRGEWNAGETVTNREFPERHARS